MQCTNGSRGAALTLGPVLADTKKANGLSVGVLPTLVLQPHSKMSLPAMDEIPKWLKAAHRQILIGFKRQGGEGNVADARRMAGVQAADSYLRRLEKHGLITNPSRDYYRLTPAGFALANLLLESDPQRSNLTE